jgi:hypothetical protein
MKLLHNITFYVYMSFLVGWLSSIHVFLSWGLSSIQVHEVFTCHCLLKEILKSVCHLFAFESIPVGGMSRSNIPVLLVLHVLGVASWLILALCILFTKSSFVLKFVCRFHLVVLLPYMDTQRSWHQKAIAMQLCTSFSIFHYF